LGAGLDECRWLSLVGGYLLGRRDEPNLAVQAVVVASVEVFEHGVSSCSTAHQGPRLDQLRLDLPDRGRGQDAARTLYYESPCNPTAGNRAGTANALM
jgi:hypothetical protein